MARGTRACLVGSASAALLLAAPAAVANGRFPNASQLLIDPSDPKRIALSTTFGIIQTTDGGANWRWICERAIGYSGIFDPAIAVTGNGTLLAGLPASTSRTSDRGCTWPVSTSASVSSAWVIDLAIDRSDPNRAIALMAPASTERGFQATIAESRDNGQSWRPGVGLTEDFTPTTADVAPSMPTRVYVVGKGPHFRFGELARSGDGGATWVTVSTFDLGEATLGEPALVPFLSAVHPTNPDALYMRISDAKGDRLEHSPDGGETWNTLFRANGELLGFALSPDGSKLAVGGPRDGIHVATVGSGFKKVSEVGARCLTYASDALWVCGNEALDGFTVGRSTDDGVTISPLLHLPDLLPLECAAGTVTQQYCPGDWPALAAAIGAKVGTDAGVTDVGSIGTPPEDATFGPPPTPDPALSVGGGGCGCSTRPSVELLDRAVFILLIAILARRRARRASPEASKRPARLHRVRERAARPRREPLDAEGRRRRPRRGLVRRARGSHARANPLRALDARLCVCDLSRILSRSMPATSHALQHLRRLRLVKYRMEGKLAYYSLRAPWLRDVLAAAIERGEDSA